MTEAWDVTHYVIYTHTEGRCEAVASIPATDMQSIDYHGMIDHKNDDYERILEAVDYTPGRYLVVCLRADQPDPTEKLPTFLYHLDVRRTDPKPPLEVFVHAQHGRDGTV